MRLVEFDGRKFSDDTAARLAAPNAKRECLRQTGVTAGTLSRIVQGHAPKDITSILSLCAYLNLSVKDYVRI